MISRAEHQRQRELVHQANHDVLTALPNRQRMTADFKAMKKANEGGLSLLFIDMDNFKSVNDGFGHVQGDALLKELGRRLDAFASVREKVARIGGDEFVLLTPETDETKLLARADGLIARLAASYTVNDVRCELGCSVGIARCRRPAIRSAICYERRTWPCMRPRARETRRVATIPRWATSILRTSGSSSTCAQRWSIG